MSNHSFIFSKNLFLSEPPCLAELERIQVLDGGKRKYGRYLTSHNTISTQLYLSLLFEGFHRADDKQEAGISPWSVLWIRTWYWQTAKESSHQWVLHVRVSGRTCERVHACAHCRFWLNDWALSQDSPRTQTNKQRAVCQPNAQMFPWKTGQTVLSFFLIYIIIKVFSDVSSE